MLKANALFMVVVIALIVGLLTSGLILTAYYHRMTAGQQLLLKKLDLNATSAIELMLAEDDLLEYGEEKTMDLYGEESDSVWCKKMPWGLFEVGLVKTHAGNKTQAKAFIYGAHTDSASNTAIYLTDTGVPLSVSGHTYIKGTCYLPQAGVKSAYIEGQDFKGNTLIQGMAKKSAYELPPLHKPMLKHLELFFTNPMELLKGQAALVHQLEGDSINRSFLDTTLFYYSGNNIDLHHFLKGNIIVCSSTLVRISASAVLEDVLVVAPAIQVESGFVGNAQLFATDSLLIGPNCTFSYPSALGLFKQPSAHHQAAIYMGKNTRFKGVVFTRLPEQDLQQTLVQVSEGSHIEGKIYADGYVELLGKVSGSIVCRKFILRTAAAIYENHLLNAQVDYSRLPPQFVGSSLFSSAATKQIAKWLQ